MARTRDLFAGRSVRLELVADRWAVSLCRSDGSTELVSTYVTRSDALEAVEAWMDLMTDEAEVEGSVDLDALFAMLREAAARTVAGEGIAQPVELGAVIERDQQREWFTREMGRC